MMKPLIVILLLLCAAGCAQLKTESLSKGPAPETHSFSGEPLYAKPMDSVVLAKADSSIQVVRKKSPLTEDDYIEISRLLVGTYQFKLAVENFTTGLKEYPNSYKLLRHRGHRYLNLRELDKAIADLTKAEELIRSQPDVWEYDATTGKPSATYQHQIWYHIGLYHYLKKDYKASAAAYEKSLAATKEGKNIAGASDWLYNAYERQGQRDKALAVLKPFTAAFEIEDRDYPYFRRLLLFNGVITPEELVDERKPIEQLSLSELTKLYGLANWYRYHDNSAKANELYKKVLQSKEWAGFAYACAELDVAK